MPSRSAGYRVAAYMFCSQISYIIIRSSDIEFNPILYPLVSPPIIIIIIVIADVFVVEGMGAAGEEVAAEVSIRPEMHLELCPVCGSISQPWGHF